MELYKKTYRVSEEAKRMVEEIAAKENCTETAVFENAIRCYRDVHCTAPIRVDHVPTMAGEANNRPRYETVGRLYAIGYLRGLMDASGYDLL